MKCERAFPVWLLITGFLPFLFGIGLFAEDGKLIIHSTPKQAYVFVDGQPIGEANKHRTLTLSVGPHLIELANYGYAPSSNNVTITPGQNKDLEVTLEPVKGAVSGPFGAITIEGASRAAVMLNGRTPAYFVGHADEFNHNWWWKQELIVPPGRYQISVLQPSGGTWTEPVEVPANQRVVIDIPNGVRKTVAWPRGEKLTSIPRFTTGTASATVAVAKPTADLSVTSAQVNCGESSQLKWTSTDAAKVEINPMGEVVASGEEAVQPKQTTSYQLTGFGPGGTANSSATVTVNTAVQADVSFSPSQVQYHRVGDQVVQEGSAMINWTAVNSNSVSIDPLGSVPSSGRRTLQLVPHRTEAGAVNENVTYTLRATNNCGGTETKTATLHLTGMIEEPDSGLALNSIFFPTDLPAANSLAAGLVSSQQENLKHVADLFKDYMSKKPEAHLILMGHADERGPETYNQSLSERRAEAAKAFLMGQGVPADRLDTQAFGKAKNLTDEQVKGLLEQNTSLTDDDRQNVSERLQTLVLANNRRVDIVLSTTGRESAQQYPFKAADYATLVSRHRPGSTDRASQIQQAAERKAMPN